MAKEDELRAVTIDCAGVQTEKEIWQRYLDAAQPEGASRFGRNLNAFWDAIIGGGPGWPGEVTLVFTNTADIRRIAGGAYFLKVLEEFARSTHWVTIELR